MSNPEHIGAESPFARLELMWGPDGLARLREAFVVVLGIGGVGSNCVEALARGGVGSFFLVDGDAVAPSNINRQAIAFTTTVGKRKVEVMRDMIGLINPQAAVELADTFLHADDVAPLLDRIVADNGTPTYLIDAIDTVSAKLAAISWAHERRIPMISSMGGAMKLDPAKLRICDLFETAHDPLARVMRKECRKRGVRGLTVVSSFEEPLIRANTTDDAPMPPTEAPSEHPTPCLTKGKRPLGTASYLPPIMGQMIAGHVIRAVVAGLDACGADIPR